MKSNFEVSSHLSYGFMMVFGSVIWWDARSLRLGVEHALRAIFPGCPEGTGLVRVRCLKKDKALLMQELEEIRPLNLLQVPKARYRRKPVFTKEHPNVLFRGSRLLKRKAATYFERVAKRVRRMYLQ